MAIVFRYKNRKSIGMMLFFAESLMNNISLRDKRVHGQAFFSSAYHIALQEIYLSYWLNPLG
jgi:hypothetical protein